ncbi:MAG: nucleotidyltransferase family protein [Lachnospiraceae bacterium]
MTDLYDSVFALLQAALFDSSLKMEDTVAWSEIALELAVQCVLAIPADKIELLELTDAEKKEYIWAVMGNISFWNSIMYEQQEITDLLWKASIPAAVLKGSAAAIYYPVPDYRCMGDIDLIVLPETFDKACALLEQAGYIHDDSLNDRHESFQKNGIHIELHRYFAFLNDKEEADYLDNLIYEGIHRTERKKLGEYSFLMLPRLENGLVLLSHISQHLEGGLGLRQIIDWMLYVNSELDDQFWQDSFCSAAENIGLKKLALVTTRMCQIYLGLTEEITWCRQAEEALCEELMLFIMNHGNFGRKDEGSSKTIFVLYYMRNPFKFLKVLQRIGCKTWELLRKYPWLKPFAWVYQIYRWGSHGLQRSDAIRETMNDIGKAKREDKFLEKLEVTRRNKLI